MSPAPSSIAGFLERSFGLAAAGTSPAREVAAGGVTFATLSYIVFVQPAVLATTGMDPGGVLFATCVASALACFLMAWWGRLPFALAPAMGHNFFFAFTVCGTLGMGWREALAANFLAGAAFLLIAPTGARAAVMRALPPALRGGIAAGIGLLIALVGLEWGGIVVADPATYVRIGSLDDPASLWTLAGLLICSLLLARRVPGAILWGMSASLVLGWMATLALRLDPPLVRFEGLFAAPPSPRGTAFQLDFSALFARPFGDLLAVLFLFLFLDLFDSVGSLIGLARQLQPQGGGEIPRARGAFAADAAGTVAGALLGTSTVTTYVESAAGIASGGRTGLVACVVGVGFLLALFCQPLVEVVAAGVALASDPAQRRYPLIAPVLILVGALMMGALRDVDWDEPGEAIPAFLTAVLIPLGFSIADGIGWGLASHVLLELVRGRRPGGVVSLLAALFVLRQVLL